LPEISVKHIFNFDYVQAHYYSFVAKWD